MTEGRDINRGVYRCPIGVEVSFASQVFKSASLVAHYLLVHTGQPTFKAVIAARLVIVNGTLPVTQLSLPLAYVNTASRHCTRIYGQGRSVICPGRECLCMTH
jgi:hypothetical protein